MSFVGGGGMKSAAKFSFRAVSVLISLALTFCCMLVQPVSSAEQQYISLQEYADRLGYLVNCARADAGLEPLLIAPYLTECANIRAEECCEVFGHTRPNGERGIYIVDENVLFHSAAAENIGAGRTTPEDALEQWKDSPKHWEAILSPDYNYTGIGIYYDPDSTYKWYWTEIFVTADDPISDAYIPLPYQVIPKCSGDLTGDGNVNCFDYIMMKKELLNDFHGLNPLQKESADVMADGSLNISDLVIMRGYILGKFDHVPMTIGDLIKSK